jgi:hypothetical protein
MKDKHADQHAEIKYGQYEVAAYTSMYFTITTFFHILEVLIFINVYVVVFHFNVVIYVFFIVDHWGDLGVDGWIILGWISRRWDVGMWTGLG